jgi:hypothetical protein
MTRKQQLENELAEIKKLEEAEAESRNHQSLIDKKLYVPLKRGKITSTIWYLTEYDFKEISDDFYTASQILGKPTFRKGDEVVLIDCQGDKRWFKKQENKDYLYIEDEEYGIAENNLEYIGEINDL